MTPEEITALIAGVGSFIAILAKHFGPDATIRDQTAKTEEQSVKLEGRLVRLETKIDLFWMAVEQNIPRLLKQPTHLLRDRLLDKMSKGNLSREEAKELMEDLKNDTEASDGTKVLALTLVLARLQQLVDDNG